MAAYVARSSGPNCPHHAGPSAGASLCWFSSLIPIRQPSRMPAHLGACAHRRAIDSRTTPKKRSIDQESAIHRATSVGNKQSVASAATSCRARFSAGRCTRRQEPCLVFDPHMRTPTTPSRRLQLNRNRGVPYEGLICVSQQRSASVMRKVEIWILQKAPRFFRGIQCALSARVRSCCVKNSRQTAPR
jgi:hypothetical protein